MENQNLPAVQTNQPMSIEAVLRLPGAPAYMTNAKGTPREVYKIMSQAQSASAADRDRARTEPFLATYYVCHLVEMTDDRTGELLNLPRTVFVAPDGSAVPFVSMGVMDSLELLVASLGAGPWDPPLKLSVRESKTRKGRNICQLVLED
jgi:Phage Single-stranded DNA-binding protein